MFERFSLNSFKFFYYVALNGNVTTASKKLFVTQTAVSKQIKNLEASLNVTLFNRNGNSLELTKDGLFLFNYCQNIFTQLDDCLVKINNNSVVDKNLIISCEPTICMKWLIPRLNQFNNLNYDFQIKLITSSADDLNGQIFDLAVRRNIFPSTEYYFNKKITDEIMFFVCNSDLAANDKILISKSRANFRNNLLNIHSIRNQIINLKHKELDHFYLCIEGCLSGLGSTIVSGFMIEKELQNNFLRILSKPFFDGSSYYLLSSQPFEEDYRKIIFEEWFRTEMQKTKDILLGM
ncbi:LysR family transcriptional regulator [Acinetobacter guillouiae]|uniref:LysR family transcriptional regulator n=1 Tax=Acinetobacter guillouiae TaxID=106649 RepID=UPI0021D2A040|nr:LysR family transcriptional regulator [Acinetobacter guillouiae]MCU4492259.1 LysR family transcriptional regulator [Acinetobacter guillouiae]